MPTPIMAGVTAAKTLSGKLLTPKQHLFVIDADDWEEFLLEWAQFQKTKYKLVARLGGANDLGVDVACFQTEKGFAGEWDNYQCKYYKGDPLAPRTAISELGKILWHAFDGKISLPKRYYFFAPKDCGSALKKLLLDPDKLKERLIEKWDDWCGSTITSTKKIALASDFLAYVDEIDFSMFRYKPTHEVIEDHRETPFFLPRFGGGLPDRPKSSSPPDELVAEESRYIEQLFEAYSDKEKTKIDAEELANFGLLERHFNRQREAFFHAESLRAFARDNVPAGTFDSLKDEIYDGVVDTCEASFPHGLDRLSCVVSGAVSLELTANGLIQVTKVQDRRGICHQLANEDRLTWVPAND